MTVDETMDGKNAGKSRMSVAQQLRNNAQLSPRSQDGIESEMGTNPMMNIGAYDKATIRIIAQFLDSIGLQNSVEALVEETGFKIETSAGARIRSSIMNGNYDGALEILHQARDLPDDKSRNARHLIQCFKLADLIRKGRLFEAVYTLKTLTEVSLPDESTNADFLNCFVKDIMLGGNRYQNINATVARENQLTFLEDVLPSDFILPANRLKSLLQRELYENLSNKYHFQIPSCVLEDASRAEDASLRKLLPNFGQCSPNFGHPVTSNLHGPATDDKASSLIRDEEKPVKKTTPYMQTQLWDYHSSPIYCVKFSRDGKMMASGGKSNQITLWDVKSSQIKRIGEMASLTEGEIGYLEICPENKYLLVTGANQCKFHLTIFDIATRAVHRSYRVSNAHEEIIDIGAYFTCASFLYHRASRKTRVVAGNEHGALKVYDLHLTDNHPIKMICGFRVRCLYGTKNGDTFYASDTLNRVRQYSAMNTRVDGVTLIKEDTTIISMVVHPCERLILTVTDVNLRLWDIRTKNLVRVFSGACQRDEFNKYFIHTSFGGTHHNFIATGSIGKETEESLRDNDQSKREHGRIIIWSADESRPRHELIGHRGHVNAVAWNPADASMIVSSGDDGTVRVWKFDKSETAEYSECVPRKVPKAQKKRIPESSGPEIIYDEAPSTSKNGGTKELIKSLREKCTTRVRFESDLKMEQLWIANSRQAEMKNDLEELPVNE